MKRLAMRLTALAAVLAVAGCGSGRYPVTGKVVYEDGSPVTEGSVIAECADGGTTVMAQGDIKSDGSFELGSDRPGEGALPGKYRAIVMPRALGDAELAQGLQPAVDGKFTRYDSSGITFEVKEGRNELNITVTRPKSKKK